MARTEKDRRNDLVGFSLMTAFMTTNVIMDFAFDGEDNSFTEPTALVGVTYGRTERRDGGMAARDLFMKWCEGLHTVCESFRLRDQPDVRRNQVSELVTSITRMTADVFQEHRLRSPIGLLESWMLGLDNVLTGLLPLDGTAIKEVRTKLKDAIRYGMITSQDDKMLPAAMQASFTPMKPVDLNDTQAMSSILTVN